MDLSETLRPRIILHTPMGDAVLDPLGPGDPLPLPPGFSYEVVFGEPNIPVDQLLSARAGGAGLAALVIGGAVFFALSRRRARRRHISERLKR